MRLALLTASLVLGSVFALNAQPAPALRIVILEGEDAVNIIQQTTAVRARRDGIDEATSHLAEITASGRPVIAAGAAATRPGTAPWCR